MSNPKTKGRLKRFGYRLIGPVRTRKRLAAKVRAMTEELAPFTFPLDGASVKNVLVILPPEPLQVLHQLRNIGELRTFFKNARMVIFAESTSAPLAGLINGAEVLVYERDEKKLGSAAFVEFSKQFKNAFDICCLLTPCEDLPLLFCAGSTASLIRIGYLGAGGSPFLNLHVNPSFERVYRSDWNSAMAEMLGARRFKNQQWTIAKDTAAEISHLFKELHCNSATRPAGIDALYCMRTFGTAWTDDLIKACLPYAKNRLYLFASESTDDSKETAWLSQHGLPVIQGLSIPQVAALVAGSALCISGNSLYFGLATLLGTAAIGVFEVNEIDAFCPKAARVSGVSFEKKPDSSTVSAIVAALPGLFVSL